MEKVNLQRAGNSAKPYQVKQVRNIIVKYKLGGKLMYKYEIIIYWSKEDAVFIAEIPELPGCMAHGDTPEDALKMPQKRFNYGLILLKNVETRYPNQREND